MRIRLAIACFALLCVLSPAAADARPKVPPGFVGMLVDGPVTSGETDLDEQLAGMRAAGVGHVRFVMYWDVAQPYASFAEVPEAERDRFVDVGGVPTDWREADQLFSAATSKRLEITAVVLRAPKWAKAEPFTYAPPSPRGRVAYAAFLTALIDRYGTGGAIFAARPDLPPHPITLWQIWNEPDGPSFWEERDVESDYVDLLQAAYPAVKAADPNAKVVAAGLFGFSWRFLSGMYNRGAKGFFDIAAVHPFTDKPSGVIEILRRVRRVMRRNGEARKPMIITELSWPSSLGQAGPEPGFAVDERGQASRLRTVYRQLAAKRKELRIVATIWATWISRDQDKREVFDYSGLFKLRDGRIVAKPAFRAFRDVVRLIS